MKDGENQLVQVHSLLQRGKHKEALGVLRKLLATSPDMAEAHYLAASILAKSKTTAEALKHAERAYQLAPNNAAHGLFLGQLYVRFNLYEFAYPLLKAAHRASPHSFEVNSSLANYYLEVDLGLLAISYFETALTHAPDLVRKDNVKLKFAECLLAVNEPLRANEILRGLAEKSALQDAAKILRGLSCSKPIDPQIARDIEDILARPNLDIGTKSQCLLALGRICDLQGEFDRAFSFWQQSRSLLGVKKHSKSALDNRNLQTRAIYGPTVLKDASQLGDPTDALVFIVGMPRSGTTLTAQILAAHSRVVSVGETDRINMLDVAFRKDYWHENPEAKILANAKRGELRQRAKETLDFFQAITDPGWMRVVEKSPTNYESLGYIHLCFPKARFIHCRRHPADNFISAYQQNMNRNHDYSYDQVAFAERYLAQEAIMKYWKSCFPEQVLEVVYEELVAHPEKVIRRIVQFTGLAWEDSCLQFHTRKSTVRTPSAQQVRQPVYGTSAGRWRHYEQHLVPLLNTIGAAGYRHPQFER